MSLWPSSAALSGVSEKLYSPSLAPAGRSSPAPSEPKALVVRVLRNTSSSLGDVTLTRTGALASGLRLPACLSTALKSTCWPGR